MATSLLCSVALGLVRADARRNAGTLLRASGAQRKLRRTGNRRTVEAFQRDIVEQNDIGVAGRFGARIRNAARRNVNENRICALFGVFGVCAAVVTRERGEQGQM